MNSFPDSLSLSLPPSPSLFSLKLPLCEELRKPGPRQSGDLVSPLRRRHRRRRRRSLDLVKPERATVVVRNLKKPYLAAAVDDRSASKFLRGSNRLPSFHVFHPCLLRFGRLLSLPEEGGKERHDDARRARVRCACVPLTHLPRPTDRHRHGCPIWER